MSAEELASVAGTVWSPGVLDEVSARFGVGAVREVRALPEGLMNDNWRLDTDAGAFALKRIRDVSFDTARRNLRTVAALAEADVPVPSPVLARDGDPVVELGADGFSMLPWITGSHRPGRDLGLPEASALGVLLGRLHKVLNSGTARTGLPDVVEVPQVSAIDPATASVQVDRYLAYIASLDEPTGFDQDAGHFLARRRLLLEKHGDERPPSGCVKGPCGWTHGDVQYRNILWRGGEVVAVLDWDRIRVRPFGEEAARTATVQFGGEDGFLDLERVRAFMAGYRSVIEISATDLMDEVSRLWWKRMTDPWVLVFHYDRDDHSCDHLFAPQERFLAWWTERRDEVTAAFTATG